MSRGLSPEPQRPGPRILWTISHDAWKLQEGFQ
jgi:hypothetical protein